MDSKGRTYRHLKLSRLHLSVSAFFLSILIPLLSVSSSYAIDLSQDVDFVWSNNSPHMRITNKACVSGGCGSNVEDWSTSVTTAWTNANSVTRIYDLYLGTPVSNRQSGTTYQYQSGDLIVQTLYIWQNGLSISAHNYVTGIAYGGIHPVNVIDVQFEELSANSGIIKIISRVNSAYLDDNDLKFVGNPAGTGLIDLQGGYTSNGTTGPAYMRPGISVLYRPRGQIDNSSAINSINSQLPTIINGLDDVNDSINDLRSVQEQANDDANDRYQDEKDTIQHDASSGQSAFNNQNLTFQAPTGIFSWMWSFGTTENCVDITAFANMIHSNETTYCSWYDTNTRSIISPAINIFLIAFISGFVLRWLKKGGI